MGEDEPDNSRHITLGQLTLDKMEEKWRHVTSEGGSKVETTDF